MSDLIKFDIVKPEIIIPVPIIPKDWDYNKSVQETGCLVLEWKALTLEIAKKLWIAREKLSKSGAGGHIRNLSGTGDPTWNQYCKSIKITKRTANRWLVAVFGPSRLASPPLPKLKSQVLYADPPWSFSNTGFDQSAAQQYSTLSLEEIRNYTDKKGKTIRKLANEKQSVLFLWVPAALIAEGLEVIKGWGFIYKSQMVWKKDKSPGMGWWVKSKHELLFIASKGEGLHPAIMYDSVFEAPVTKHSRKPEKVYEMIESMYTGPYIELFAREERDGWNSWGNEIE